MQCAIGTVRCEFTRTGNAAQVPRNADAGRLTRSGDRIRILLPHNEHITIKMASGALTSDR